MGDDSFENFPRNLGRDFVQYSCGRPEMTPQDEEPKKAKTNREKERIHPMKTTIFSFAVLAAIIAVTILQACAATTTTTQCAKPALTPPGASGNVRNVTVTIKTATAGAYLRYTLDGSTPTGGSSGHGTRIAAAGGEIC